MPIFSVVTSDMDKTLSLLDKYQSIYPNKLSIYKLPESPGKRIFHLTDGIKSELSEFIGFLDGIDLIDEEIKYLRSLPHLEIEL